MEPECNQLIQENLSKNLADNDEYPAMLHLHQRCVSIIGNLWGARGTGRKEQAIGTATTGSSEAIMLGGLAMKRRWVEKRQEQGKDASKPNILMGANAQVALEKFARYFDVEARIIPVSKDSKYCLDITKIREYLDENTIGIFVILGSTYTGHYEPVEKVAELLDEYEKETGLDIPIHVDGASGALFCPFTTPSVKWDFRIPRVKSINSYPPVCGLWSW
jgi:glutamate decarboxylase